MTSEPPLPVPPRPPLGLRAALRLLAEHHLVGGLFIVLVASLVMAEQVSTRTDFASSELSQDVESRWGAPVEQAAPSVRAVPSGTVFTGLTPLPLSRQEVAVDATMNYRKRGLVYFSGFDFTFSGTWVVENPDGHDIDVAFVFPIEVDKSQVLLSDLAFTVDERPAPLDLGDGGNRLVWTGRLSAGAKATFSIRYRARGLESFVYRLDPSLPARDVRLRFTVEGGDNVDYPEQVLSASAVRKEGNRVTLEWAYPSLESGVAMGLLLPSQKKYDQVLATMSARAAVPGLGFLVFLAALAMHARRKLLVWEAWLAAAVYGFFFVLVAYLGAVVHFYAAFAVSALGLGAALVEYVRRLFPLARRAVLWGGWLATLVVPAGAVVLEGYTGLVYTLELLAGLLGAMALLTRPGVRAWLSDGAPAKEAA